MHRIGGRVLVCTYNRTLIEAHAHSYIPYYNQSAVDENRWDGILAGALIMSALR